MSMSIKQEIKKGRAISYLLRHSELIIDKYGWADVKLLIKMVGINQNQLIKIVETNDKKRYELSENGLKIRALQGHSVNVDVELEEEVPEVSLYHGTSSFYLDSILKNGILSQNRQYVHLSSNLETALATGKRHGGNTIILQCDIDSMISDGVIFYHSKNDVWLTKFVDKKYINII